MPFSPKSLVAPATVLVVLGLALPARAEDTPPAKVVAVCSACHGREGKAVLPNYPNLGGQHRSYLEQALKSYRSTRDKNAIMDAQAKNLTDAEIKEVAAWYSSRPPVVYVPTVDPNGHTPH